MLLHLYLSTVIPLILLSTPSCAQAPIISITGNTSTPSFTASPSPPTLTPNSIFFNGTGTAGGNLCQYVSFGRQNFTIGTSGFTATVIFRSLTTAPYSRIFDLGSGPGSNNILLMNSQKPRRLSFRMYVDASRDPFDPIMDFEPNAVHRIAFSYDPAIGPNGKSSYYYNGKLVESFSSSVKAVSATHNNTFVGQSNWPSDPCFQGHIYSLKVYNRVLNESEIFNDTMSAIQTSDITSTRWYRDVLDPTANLTSSTFGWTWLSGYNGYKIPGLFGTLGVPSSSVFPGKQISY